MAQQTQASRVEIFLAKFLTKFPTVEALAASKKSEVIRQWQGLGYNRRALNLQKAAVSLLNKPFPQTEAELLGLPGVGKYTARAIMIFAFNKRVSTVDVNVSRVLSRLYKKMPDQNEMLSNDTVYALSEEILPTRNSRLWHEALMDFGATICTKRNPKCSECPLAINCKSSGIVSSTIIPKSISKEKKYFGAPKRIWRGRVLKLVVRSEGVIESNIVNDLNKSFPHNTFKPFISAILNDLTREGFIKKTRNKYQIQG
jgi:A/G-specific adenine glycosylase